MKVARRQVIVEVGLLSTASFLQGAGFSLIAPFYPNEAFDRGNSATHVGIVIGIYQLVMFVSSLFFGWAMARHRLQPRPLLCVGLLVEGFFSAAFGLTVLVKTHHLFFGVSLLLRVLQALGNSASITCYFTLLGANFPSLFGQLIPIIEAAFSAGLIAGPFFGGLLYSYLGFSLTFAVFGATLAILGVVCSLVFHNPSSPARREDLSLRSTVRNPRVIKNCILFVIALMTVGFNDATLAVHLQQFKLPAAWVGIMFIPSSLCQALLSPVWGRLASNIRRPRMICAAGAALCAACFVISGPAPYFGSVQSSSIPLTVAGQLVLGMGIGAIYIPAFLDTVRYCLTTLHYPDDVGTYALLSGLLTSALCLGSAVGSAVGGALLDLFAYPLACQWMVLLLLVTTALILGAPGRPLGSSRCPDEHNKEQPPVEKRDPLLEQNNLH